MSSHYICHYFALSVSITIDHSSNKFKKITTEKQFTIIFMRL